jgi:pimeloyl-ACP methyl ester carboxylesterase
MGRLGKSNMTKQLIIIGIIILPFLLLILLMAMNPLDDSGSSHAYYKAMKSPPAEAAEWSEGGMYFKWSSSLTENEKFDPLNIFYRTFGSRKNPAILMIHGFPTSSYDFKEIIDELKNDYFIVVLDTPGYGFSDKPKDGFKYSIFEDADIVDTLIRDIIKLDRFTLLTHDKGDSVGLELLRDYQSGASAYTIENHIMLNGGIYLPKAQISNGQKLMRLPGISTLLMRLMPTKKFTKNFSKFMFIPELSSVEIENLETVFAYQGGVSVMPETIKYLDEREKYEVEWLESLKKSAVPTTIIWGEKDPVAVPAVADHAWENYLKDRKAPAAYWRIPCAGHYLQNDQPELVAQLIRRAIGEEIELDVSKNHCAPKQI